MDSIPEDLSQLPDRENFFQLQTSDIHIYYSEEVIAMARDNGLSALIADGIYKLNPITTPDRMNKGQLYCVQAVVRGGVEYKGMWSKWDVNIFRTIHAAGAFYSKLRGVLSRRNNPPYDEMLECLHVRLLYLQEVEYETPS
ncbi:hypothetical protein Aduo_000879 [Ancylostoma duodenale]